MSVNGGQGQPSRPPPPDRYPPDSERPPRTQDGLGGGHGLPPVEVGRRTDARSVRPDAGGRDRSGRRERSVDCAGFERYAVIPVARNVWQHVDGGSPAADAARRLIMASTTTTRQRSPGLHPARKVRWGARGVCRRPSRRSFRLPAATPPPCRRPRAVRRLPARRAAWPSSTW